MKFCTLCFATENDGSWQHVVVGHFCANCGVGGAVVDLPEWAIKNIRQNASWVGKRYYPCDEDRERAEERVDLLALVQHFPGRKVALRVFNGRKAWEVSQTLANGCTVSTTVTDADSGRQAMHRATALRFVPQWRLDEVKGEK